MKFKKICDRHDDARLRDPFNHERLLRKSIYILYMIYLYIYRVYCGLERGQILHRYVGIRRWFTLRKPYCYFAVNVFWNKSWFCDGNRRGSGVAENCSPSKLLPIVVARETSFSWYLQSRPPHVVGVVFFCHNKIIQFYILGLEMGRT